MLPMLNLVHAGLQPNELLHPREREKLKGADQVLYQDLLDPTRYHEETTDTLVNQYEVYFQHVVAQTNIDLRVVAGIP